VSDFSAAVLSQHVICVGGLSACNLQCGWIATRDANTLKTLRSAAEVTQGHANPAMLRDLHMFIENKYAAVSEQYASLRCVRCVRGVR
jgi:hypothetical protein